ncbi:MAG: hypothetical protein C0608_01765 [Deltaproteobacteria bacterium]|nr:MAG: hypothetical protein C0608_01765 [Deltaproteobacteria bacterium]
MKLLGAIAGDIIGSSHEFKPLKTTDFELFTEESAFTDDSVLTVATAEALFGGLDYGEIYREYFNRYPHAGYGRRFVSWASEGSAEPYKSFGNGSAMRISPVGWWANDMAECLKEAKRSAEATHNHPEGVKGAQAVAAAVLMARQGASREEIKTFVEISFSYDLSTPISKIRPAYSFDVTCQGSVPQALRCFIESTDFESAVRLAVSLGGDADTQAAMAGSVAEAYYGSIGEEIERQTLSRLDDFLTEKLLAFDSFTKKR